MINEKKLDLSYIAGFFDGEGCINSSKSGLRATITNTDIQVLLLIQEYYKKGKIRSRKLKEFEKRKPCYMLEFWSNDAVEFLYSIYPFLIIKKDQAEIAFEYQKTYRKKAGKGSLKVRAVPKELLLLRESLALKLSNLKHIINVD